MFAPEWARSIVSRETEGDLQKYLDLVAKWSVKINLVSRSDLEKLAERHLWDSVQVFQNINEMKGKTWLDIGSGGGFPGIVGAIIAKHCVLNVEAHFVESDRRKSVFLQAACMELSLSAKVIPLRVENLTAPTADILTCRAFASIEKTLRLTQNITSPATKFILPKGSSWQDEIALASENWQFQYSAKESKTNSSAAIVELSNVVEK